MKKTIKMKCFMIWDHIASEFYIARNWKLQENINSALYRPFIFPAYWEKIALFQYFYMKYESGINSENEAQKLAALEFAKNSHDFIMDNEPIIINIKY